ncbi:N-acetylmuramoyl-L-alanine amidase [Streptomyces sp. ISL-1]|uniref:N-acetylmuramoyl-L-alanine amidase n=1 Tax=Streptomyces sp. ISL-1 TaxID=2817657 RepID=UPI001BE77E37|nr:N-acetylmuramoyl-L-alanine amidase [Streptomyces sp. ISL-1]MBT2390526.1 N-acetylmuramoyl-L-alanine amidase [Streptomyces sp. ISL-1]
MRGFLATSVGVVCSAALILPLSQPSGAIAAPPRVPDLPGSTQSLPLAPTGEGASDRSLGAATEQGVTKLDVRPFSLVGVVWDDVKAELHGTVQVRTRAVGSGDWSGWQDVETHNHEHGADLDSAESTSGKVRGSTAPLWVGASDGVEARVRPETAGQAPLPEGLRLELVDPGAGPASEGAVSEGAGLEDPAAEGPASDGSASEDPAAEGPASEDPASDGAGLEDPAAEGVGRPAVYQPAPQGQNVLPELSRAETEAQLDPSVMAGAAPYIGPRPRIITRQGWGADESLREKTFVYTASVKAAFVHHSATGNNYTCSEAPSVLRSIYRYHVVSSGWRDFGYNFAIDKCGNIYEGRAGGVDKAVLGAHTLGFNTNSVGIAVLGTYSLSTPPAAAVTAVAKLTAWKLGLYGMNPLGKVVLTSGGSGKYAKGVRVSFNVISGHRDGFFTDCPGALLYSRLGTARNASAKYQGRA